MGYYVSACLYCDGDHPCDCSCHSATQEDIEEGYGHCDNPRENY